MGSLYSDFSEQWQNTRKRKLANNTYLEMLDGGNRIGFAVRLHNTRIIYAYADSILLHAGDWRTVTTKERINRFLPEGFSVTQRLGAWYLSRGHHNSESFREWCFADGITISTVSGEVSNYDETPIDTAKLSRKLSRWAETYIDKLELSEISSPNGGDCWGCHMQAADGSYPMGTDCIPGHVSENYFHGSLIVRALHTFPSAPIAWGILRAYWGAEEDKLARIYRAGGPFSLKANGGSGKGMGRDFLKRPLLKLLKWGHNIAR